MQRFALDALAAGADAFFLATQVATRSLLSPAELATFARPYDLALLDALRGKADFVLLHVHGEDIYFEEMAAYPVQAINWHDRRTPPSLAEGMSKFGGAVVGGLDDDLMLHGAPHQVRAQVEDAIRQTQGLGLIVAAGCVTLTGTPEANLRAVRDAVDR